MAAGVYNTEAFVSSVRRKALLPPSDDGVSFPRDSDIIDTANEEMDAMLVPWLMQAREGFFLQTTTIPLVANQANYTMPQRAVAAGAAYLTLLDSSGNPVYPGLVEADLEVAVAYPYTSALYGQPLRYYFRGNDIVLVPTPSDSTLSIGVYYPQRPNQLVKSTSVTAITATAQGSSTFTITYTALPTTGTTFTSGLAYECVHKNPGFEAVALGTASSVTSTVATFPGTLPSGVNVGDSLCLQDTANYPTYVPADVYLGMFSQWVALKIAETRRDAPGVQALSAGFKASEKIAREFLGRRDRLAHRKVSNASNRVWGRRPLYFAR